MSVSVIDRKTDTIVTDLSVMTTTKIKDLLREALKATVTGIWHAAAAVKELENRGEDLSDLHCGLLAMLRKVAHGQVIPEVLVEYQGAPRLMQRIAALPLPDQKRLTGPDRAVEVLTSSGSTRKVDPDDLTTLEQRQVFGPSGIHSLSQQRGFLDDLKKTEPRAKDPDDDLCLDRKRREIVIAGKRYPVSRILKLIAELEK